MSHRFTIITLQPPDPTAWSWAAADLAPDLVLAIDDVAECWRISDPSGQKELFAIDVPLRVRVQGEIRRMFGHDAGFDFSGLDKEPDTYWNEVHVTDPSERAESLAARFCRKVAHLSDGTCIDHDGRFTHLGEVGPHQRREWT